MKTAFLYPSQSGDHAHYTVPSCDVWALRVGVERFFHGEFLAYLESILRIWKVKDGLIYLFPLFSFLFFKLKFKEPRPNLKKSSKKILMVSNLLALKEDLMS